MEKDTYLTFTLGKELFAVNVKNVLEVIEQQQITKVPKAPGHILGIMNFRGEILPVVNTRHKFNLNGNLELLNYLVIVYIIESEEQEYCVAATADAVNDVIEISADQIKTVPDMGISYDSHFIAGAAKIDEEYVLFIHPEKVFSILTDDISKKNVAIN